MCFNRTLAWNLAPNWSKVNWESMLFRHQNEWVHSNVHLAVIRYVSYETYSVHMLHTVTSDIQMVPSGCLLLWFLEHLRHCLFLLYPADFLFNCSGKCKLSTVTGSTLHLNDSLKCRESHTLDAVSGEDDESQNYPWFRLSVPAFQVFQCVHQQRLFPHSNGSNKACFCVLFNFFGHLKNCFVLGASCPNLVSKLQHGLRRQLQ